MAQDANLKPAELQVKELNNGFETTFKAKEPEWRTRFKSYPGYPNFNSMLESVETDHFIANIAVTLWESPERATKELETQLLIVSNGPVGKLVEIGDDAYMGEDWIRIRKGGLLIVVDVTAKSILTKGNNSSETASLKKNQEERIELDKGDARLKRKRLEPPSVVAQRIAEYYLNQFEKK